MRTSAFLAGAGAIVAFGFLGFRILDLEQQLSALNDRLEHEHEAHDERPRTPLPAASSSVAVSPTDYEARLRLLEQRLEAVADHKQAAPVQTGNLGADRLKQEQAILSVMERENSRIREVQLEWHKARWLETRRQQLAGFAFSQRLEPEQSGKLYDALEHELDSLADVMKRPSFAEEPDQVASDWLKILNETDQRAQQTLAPAQYQTWLQGRLFERKVLWPWLPDAPPETAQR
jgi:hypothetical protein